MEALENNKFAILDKNGMVIEKSEDYDNTLSGYIVDMVQKSRHILDDVDNTTNIEIFMENSVMMIKDNSQTNLTMAMIIDKTK